MRLKKIILFSIIFLTILACSTFMVKKIKRDRQTAMNYKPPVFNPVSSRTTTGPASHTKTYTKEELDEMRKKGKSPEGIKQPYTPPQPNTANDAAVQRSLRTIEEINKINDMNQRLLDQQRRMQNQK
jgi:hypothetical protein